MVKLDVFYKWSFSSYFIEICNIPPLILTPPRHAAPPPPPPPIVDIT